MASIVSRTKFISIRINLFVFVVVGFVFCKSAFPYKLAIIDHQRFEIVIHSFIITTANPEENPDKHSCLWEYHVSLISLQEITPRLMDRRSY